MAGYSASAVVHSRSKMAAVVPAEKERSEWGVQVALGGGGRAKPQIKYRMQIWKKKCVTYGPIYIFEATVVSDGTVRKEFVHYSIKFT